MADLSDRERGFLELEGRWFKYGGAKANLIREAWGISFDEVLPGPQCPERPRRGGGV
jgi:hypothetical protein